MRCSGGEVRHGQLIISPSFLLPKSQFQFNLIMTSPHKDGWVKLLPPDEFCLDTSNPLNASNGRRNRLVRVDRDDTHFAEGV